MDNGFSLEKGVMGNGFSESVSLADWQEQAEGKMRDPLAQEGTVQLGSDGWDARLAAAREQDRARRESDMRALQSVWLYEEDEDARKLVDGHGQYSVYQAPTMRLDDALPCYGKDFARAADPEYADMPLELCRRMMGTVEDEGRRKGYQEELQALQAGREDSRAYYGLYGKMVRDGVRAEYGAWKAKREAALAENERNERCSKRAAEMVMEPYAFALGNKVQEGGSQGASVVSPEAQRQLGENLEAMQWLKDTGRFERAQKVNGAVSAMFGNAQGLGRNARVLREEDCRRACQLLEGDAEAQEWFFSLVAERARMEAKQGETGLLQSFADVFQQSFQDVEDLVADGKLWDDVVPFLGEPGKAVENHFNAAVSSLGGQGVSAEEMGRVNEARREQRVKTAAFAAQVRQAMEEGYASADEAGETGLWAESRRNVGKGLGFVASWMVPGNVGKVFKAASTASMGQQSLEAVAVRHPGRSADELLRAAGRETAGETVGMMFGTRLLKAGFRMMPGASSAGMAMTRGAARKGWRGVARGLAQGTAMTAADFGVVVPTATALTKGTLNVLDGVDDEMSTGWEDWKESMAALADPKHDTELLVQSAVLTGGHAPAMHAGARKAVARLRQAQRAVNRRFRFLGGRDEVAREAWAKFPNAPQKAAAWMEERLRAEYEEAPIAVQMRAADALKVEVDAENARAAMEDRAARALLVARHGVAADVLQDGRVRVYTEARYENGEVVKGEKYSDVDADVAERYLGRLHEGNLREHAQALRQGFVGRLAIEEFLKLYGSAGREELLEKPQSMEDLRRDAERAEAKMRELMAGDESRREAVGKMIVPEISPELTLEAVAALPQAFGDRVAVEAARGGAGAATAAYVVPVRLGDGAVRYVLRHTQQANWFALSEELAEQALLRYQRLARSRGEEGFSDEALGRDLLDLRDWMREYGEDGKSPFAGVADSFLGLSGAVERKLRAGDALEPREAEELNHAVVEAFSQLFRSGLVSEAMEGQSRLPEWAQDVMSACVSASVQAPELARLGEALRRAAAGAESPEGAERYQQTVNELWQNHRDVVQRMFEPYREPTEADYLQRMEESDRLQEELDARLGRGVSIVPEATEAFLEEAGREREAAGAERQEAEAQAQEREKLAVEDLRDKPGNGGKSPEELAHDRVEAYGDHQQEAVAMDAGAVPDAEGVFSGGRYVVIQSAGFADVKAGMVPVGNIRLSADAPQFKLGAGKDGVVHPLAGLYRPDHAPICVWQRTDGRLEVISGRHRLAYAKQAGASRIFCYVYKESAERDARWARTFDLEQNIRDNMASEVEVALYVRGENAYGRPLEDGEIDAAGIARQGTRGQIGVLLGRYAADGVLDALRNGLPLDDAVRVVEFAKGDRDVQLEGLRVMRGEADALGGYTNPGSMTEARNVMRRFLEVKRALADAEAAGEQGSLFGIGFGESLQDTEFNRFFGRYQNARMRDISRDRAYLNKLVGNKLSPRQAEKYGVDVKDPDGLKKRLDELSALYERWKNPAVHADLMEEMRRAFKEENAGQGWLDETAVDAPAEVPACLREPVAEWAHFSLKGEDLTKCYAVNGNGDRLGRDVFIQTPAGKLNWFEFPKDERTQGLLKKKGIKDLPIRLRVGSHAGEHRGFGFLHLLNHVDDMAARGESPLLHLYNTLTNLTGMNAQGGSRYAFKAEKSYNEPSFLIVDLMEDAGSYSIVTCYPTVRRQMLKGSELLIGRAVFRFSHSSDKTRLNHDIQSDKATLGAEIASGKAREGMVADERPSVNIHDVKIRNRQGEVIFQQGREAEVEWAHFSTFSPAEVSAMKALQGITKGKKEAVFRSDTLGEDVLLPLGSAGKLKNPNNQKSKIIGEHGFLHIIATRMAHGESMEEASYTCAKAMLAAVNGKINEEKSQPNKKMLCLDGYDSWVYLKWKDEDKAWIVTGYKENEKVTGADAKRQAVNLAERYALDSFGGLNQVGAALDYAIARVAREYKGNHADDTRKLSAHFSLGGESAETFGEMQELGLTYFDPADGKRKFCLDTRGVRLSSGFTRGQVLGVKEGKHLDASLKSLVVFPELYRAYPALAKIRVRVFNGGAESAGLCGYYNPHDRDGAHIAVNATALKAADAEPGRTMEAELLDTLLHEAQHAIQHHEGWSRGAGGMDKRGAQKYLAKAILARREKGLESAWAKANMEFMQDLLVRVNAGDGQAVESVYWLSHGEQEARFAGAGHGVGASEAGLDPMKALARMPGRGVSAVAESWMTVPVPAEVTELGGLTFGTAGRYARTMDSRLAPMGDFYADRRMYQKREAAMRRLRELRALSVGKGKEGSESLLLEAVQVAHSLVSALPREYAFGMEPYDSWLAVFSKLGGEGSPEAAAGMVTMKGWNRTMLSSFRNILGEMMNGRMRKADEEFWAHDAEGLKVVEELRARYEEAREQAEAELQGEADAAGLEPAALQARAAARALEALRADAGVEGLVREFYKHLGQVKVERVLARMMERVVQRLDEYRKDRTLGRIRRVADAVYPRPGKDGKPVKGVMDAGHYRRLEGYMRLLEMRKGEWDVWMQEHYPEEGEVRWEDEPLDKRLALTLYDAEGKPEVREYTVAEVNAYACYEGMDAARAEAVARSLGEFVATGRNAWENAQAEHRAKLARWAEPLLEETGALDENAMSKVRKELDLKLGTKQSFFAPGDNDVQFFDVLKGVPALRGWAGEIGRRLAHADAMHNGDNAECARRLYRALREEAGCRSKYKAVDFIQECKEERDTGIVLQEQEPDFFEAASAEYRRQVLGVLQRKVQRKNYRARPFYLALRALLAKNGLTVELRQAVAEGVMPEGMDAGRWAQVRFCAALEKEVLDKYGARGAESLAEARSLAADKAAGQAALESVFTPRELERLAGAAERVAARVAKAREAWLGRKEEKAPSELAVRKEAEAHEDRKALELSPAQAAYVVLLGEQADYAEMLRLKGYTPEVMERLRGFAGERMMRVAYALREALNERTPELEAYYERKYGMPFPKVDNYFRAVFDADRRVEARDVLEGYGGAAAGSGREAVLRTRSQSVNKQLDLAADVFGVFELAMREQSVILRYGDISRDLAGLLNFRDGKLSFRLSLEKAIGRAGVAQVRAWAEAINWIAPEMEQSMRDAQRFFSRLQRVAAKALLPLRAGTNVKQFTAVFNTLGGSEYVDGLDWMRSFARVSGGRGVMALKEMARRPALAGRFRGWGMGALMEVVSAPRGKRLAKRAEAVADWGMEVLEFDDAGSNVFSAAVLYDAVYRKMKREHPELGHEELDAAAMVEVELALARKSQPLNHRQKALDAVKLSIWKMGGLFMGSESINTFSRVSSLLREGGARNGMNAARVWLAHGLLLQVLQAGLDWLTDDEKRHRERTFWGYFWGALLGPLSGIPFVSQGVQGGIMGLEAMTGCRIPVYACGGLMPFADVKRMHAAVKRDWKVLSGDVKGASWEDRFLAYDDLMRTAAQVVASGAVFGKGKGAAVAYGSALSAAAVGNVLDFVLKVTRTFEADRR